MNPKIEEIEIVKGYEILSQKQKQQFRQVVMHGLKSKFINTVSDETKIQKTIDLWCEYKQVPIDNAYAALDKETKEVLGILMLNDFIDISSWTMLKLLIRSVAIGGIRSTVKLAAPFTQLDKYNEKLMPKTVAAEIYLVAVKENIKGRGVGTQLMNYVLNEIHNHCVCGHPDGRCTCKAMLVVFDKNPAMHLYERLGFEIADRLATPKLKKAFGDSFDTLVRMEKPI